MKNKQTVRVSSGIFIAGILMAALISGCQREKVVVRDVATNNVAPEETTWEYIPGQYVVIYNTAEIGNPQKKIGKNPVALKDYVVGVTNAVMRDLGIADKVQVQLVYSNCINGFSAKLTPEAVTALKADPRVARVEQDILVTLGKPGSGGGGTIAQTVPWGAARVNWAPYTGEGTVWIIDTGIDIDHPDLNVDASRGLNTFTTGGDALTIDDLNGHGTHCAGIAAAKDNTIGVVGVAAGATVVPVKVLSRQGSGSYGQVIQGVDFVGGQANSGDVANMSLGGPVYQPLDDAIKAAVSASGVIFTLAAGNEKDNADNHSPSRTNGANIYTISSMAKNDVWSSFSNFGASVDYCLPGSSIYSTYKNGGYATLSGTSMAAPHAAGVLLHGAYSTDGTVSGDPDGNADPILVH